MFRTRQEPNTENTKSVFEVGSEYLRFYKEKKKENSGRDPVFWTDDPFFMPKNPHKTGTFGNAWQILVNVDKI